MGWGWLVAVGAALAVFVGAGISYAVLYWVFRNEPGPEGDRDVQERAR